MTETATLWPNCSPARFSPMGYHQGDDVYQGLVLLLLTWWRFQRRDVRVAGEGGRSLPWKGRESRSASCISWRFTP
jgi:hypothetical protein